MDALLGRAAILRGDKRRKLIVRPAPKEVLHGARAGA